MSKGTDEVIGKLLEGLDALEGRVQRAVERGNRSFVNIEKRLDAIEVSLSKTCIKERRIIDRRIRTKRIPFFTNDCNCEYCTKIRNNIKDGVYG